MNSTADKFRSVKKWLVYITVIVFLLVIIGHLEYRDFRFKTIIHPMFWIALGIACIRLLRNKMYRHIQVKLIILFGIYLLISCFLLLRMVLCGSTESSILYVNKKNRSNTIFYRSYSCYQTTGDLEYYKSWNLIGELKWVVKKDTREVDSSEWEQYNGARY
jgi:predicted membrane protein